MRQQRLPPKPKINVGARIDAELWTLAQQQKISWNSALEFGLRILLADRDLIDYPDCKLLRKMWKFQQLATKLSEENETKK